MRALLARNTALRGMGIWLVVMLVGAQVITGVYGLIVYKTRTMTYTPLLICGWILLAEYLAWSHVRHRCSRFDLALPLPARRLWTASLVGSTLAGLLMLAMLLTVVALIFWLAESLEAFDTLRGGDLLRIGAILAAAVVAGVAGRHAVRPELASVPKGIRPSLGIYALNLALLAPLVWLQHLPGLLVPLLLAAAAALIVVGRRRIQAGYVLAPLATSDRKHVREDRAEGVVRPARGPRAVWLHYQMIVRTTPKGPALLVMLTPFMLLFGALLSGLILHLMPESDLRFAYVPMTAYMCLTFAAPMAANLRAVDALPLGRRYLLALISLPALLLLSAGYLGGVIWIGQSDPVVPEVVFIDEDEGYGVRVPTYMWRLSWSGEAPPATAPWGESHPVATIPVVKGAAPLVSKPYTTPEGSSLAFVAWQIERAALDMYGIAPSAAEIEERFLWTDFEDRVRLKTEDLSALAEGWTVVERNAGPFFPITLAVTSVLMYLGLAFYARAIRAGVSRTRRTARLWLVLGTLLIIHVTPHVLAISRVSRPWVIERIGTDLMLTLARAVPGGYPGLWIAALLVGLAAFEAAHAAFKQAESPVQPDTCMWNTLSKGDGDA